MKKAQAQHMNNPIQKQFEILEKSLLKQINFIMVSSLKATEIRLGEKLDNKLDEEVFLKHKDEILTKQDAVAGRIKKIDIEQDVIAYKVKQHEAAVDNHEQRLKKLEKPQNFLTA